MKTVAIVQARTGSTRFPSKVLQKIKGKSLLQIQIERMKHSKYIDEIVVATTNNPNDDIIINLCKELSYPYYRGNEFDLLDRHYRAALKFDADSVLKIPSDCPLIDPEIIDKVIIEFFKHSENYDYVSNLHPPTYPDGNDVEIMKFDTLEYAWLNAIESYQREHTTPYIYENPHKFKIANVEWETGLDYSKSLRLTVDFEQDYQLVKAIYEELESPERIFNLQDILNLIENKPELRQINNIHNGKFWYNSLKDKVNVSEILV